MSRAMNPTTPRPRSPFTDQCSTRRGTTVIRTHVRMRGLMTPCRPPSYSGKADLGDLSGSCRPECSMAGDDVPLRVPLNEGDGHRFSVRIILLELGWS